MGGEQKDASQKRGEAELVERGRTCRNVTADSAWECAWFCRCCHVQCGTDHPWTGPLEIIQSKIHPIPSIRQKMFESDLRISRRRYTVFVGNLSYDATDEEIRK